MVINVSTYTILHAYMDTKCFCCPLFRFQMFLTQTKICTHTARTLSYSIFTIFSNMCSSIKLLWCWHSFSFFHINSAITANNNSLHNLIEEQTFGAHTHTHPNKHARISENALANKLNIYCMIRKHRENDRHIHKGPSRNCFCRLHQICISDTFLAGTCLFWFDWNGAWWCCLLRV